MHVFVALATFAVIFPAELPDKTLVAALVLGSRFRPLYAWVGVAAAFAVHVVIAVTAGSLATALPHRLVELIVAILFAVGAGYLLLSRGQDPRAAGGPELTAGEGALRTRPPSFARVAGAGFTVVFLAEWGDLTQIATANLAAKYDDPVAVGLGAALALWSVAAIAVVAGDRMLRVLPLAWLRRGAGTLLAALAVVSVLAAARG